MNLLKSYYCYIQAPQEALKQVLAQRAFKQAFLGYGISALSYVLFFNIGDALSVPAFLLKLLILFTAEVTIGYIVAAACALFLDFFKIKNFPAELFILIGTSGFIKGLLVAFSLISAAVPWAQLGYLAPLALLLVWGLQLGYLTRSVKRAYQATTAKALCAWLAAFLPFVIVFMLLGIFAIWGIVLLF